MLHEKPEDGQAFRLLHIALLAAIFLLISWFLFGRRFSGLFFLADEWLYLDTSRGSWRTLWYLPGLGLFWRPLHVVVIQALYAVFGLSHLAQHIFSLLLHVFNSVMLCLLVLRLTGRKITAIIAGVFFTAFYASYEPIFWISARSHMLTAAFMLISLYFLVRFIESGGRRYYFFMLAAALPALFSHEFGLTLPIVAAFMIFMADSGVKEDEKYAGQVRRPFKSGIRTLKNIIPLFLLAALWFATEFLWARFVHQGSSGFITAVSEGRHITLGIIETFASELFFYWLDIRGHWTMLSLLVMLAFSLVFMRARARRQAILLVALGIFFIFFLAPSRAARFYYVPSFAISALYGLLISAAGDVFTSLIKGVLRDEALKRVVYFAVVIGLLYPFLLTDYIFIRSRAKEFQYSGALAKNVFNAAGSVAEGLKDTGAKSVYFVNPPVLFTITPFPPIFISGEFEIQSMLRVAFGAENTIRTVRAHFRGKRKIEGSWADGYVYPYPYLTEYRAAGGGGEETEPEKYDNLASEASSLNVLFVPDGRAVNVSGMSFDSVKKEFFADQLDH